MHHLGLVGILTCLSALAFLWHHRRRNALPYPPGPPPMWLIGNMMDIPSSFPWLRFSEWGAKYGEITYMKLLGQPIVILNTLDACKELLEKRGATTAGRPYSVILDLMGLVKAVKQHHPIHELYISELIKRLLDPSADFRFVPKYFPGANFRRYAANISELAARHTALYYDEVKNAVATGTAPPSFVSNCLDAQASGGVKSPLASRQQDEDALAWAASSMYRVLQTEQAVFKFLTAMQLYPEIQRKAQDELARVVGKERTPTVEDRDSLPNLSLHAEDGSPIDRPDEFIPERFISEKVSRPINPDEICPGRHVAHDILFLMITGMLSTCWISGPVDENGKEMPLHVEWTGKGSVSYPQPVHPRFTARSAMERRLRGEERERWAAAQVGRPLPA
ncbi:cytochrome P450 [Auricularia subglabra TFB-10046 SS5]|nr:cytochrome P450 [Auricularia subglabra TFB-10046 SS5]